MNDEPLYEIWGCYTDDEYIDPVFLEDVYSLKEAVITLKEYRTKRDFAAWILNKETGKIIKDV